MFFNAEDFNKIGGFDTNLFLYYEESDLGLRLLKERKKHAYIYPQAQYIHFKSVSIKKGGEYPYQKGIENLVTLPYQKTLWLFCTSIFIEFPSHSLWGHLCFKA